MPEASAIAMAFGSFFLVVGILIILWFSVIVQINGGSANIPLFYVGVGVAFMGGIIDAFGVLLARTGN